MFVEAGRLYKDGRFAEALEKYDALVKDGWIGGDIFYDIGNTYFKLGRTGRAIANYERARFFMPSDPDLLYNLSYARDQVQDDITPVLPVWRSMFFWMDSFSLKAVVYLFLVTNLVMFVLFICRLFYRHDFLFYCLIAVCMLWCVSALSAGIKWYDFRHDNRAVVVAETADVLAGPDEGDTLLFRLHEGSIIECEREEDGWVLARISADKRGWIDSGAVERIVSLSW
jgi:hypothetical protein